ncbi:MAG: hypothetical protein ACJAT2_002969 [Bacteriovoracaceae bacterium]|jgi:hypothetical protein
MAQNITTKPKISLFSQSSLISFALTTLTITLVTALFIALLEKLLFHKNPFFYFITANLLTLTQATATLTILLYIKSQFNFDLTADFSKSLLVIFAQTAPFTLCLIVSNLVISATIRKDRNSIGIP